MSNQYQKMYNEKGLDLLKTLMKIVLNKRGDMKEEKKSIRYKQIMWKQLGKYTHYGSMGDELHFLRIRSKPGDIFRITVDRFAPIFDHNIEKKTFKDLEEAKEYCQDVLVPRMASIFVEDEDG